MKTILITDTLFVGPPEEDLIRSSGYSIERLEKPDASEDELRAVLPGKVGYILGGIEKVTDRVLDAADELKAIAFTGSGYSEFIPAWRAATERGIAISAAVGANADSVAEYSLAAGLTLIRNLPSLTSPGGSAFYIAREFRSLHLGIIGFGNVGRALARKALALGLQVQATASSRSDEVAGVDIRELDEIVASSDLLSIHVSKGRGHEALDANAIARIPKGAVVVNAAFEGAIDNEALIKRLEAGELRAAVDYPLRSTGMPVGALLASNAQTAFNTIEANAIAGARATQSLLNLLNSGDDQDLVNPEYKNHS